jgi:hypothetical protein
MVAALAAMTPDICPPRPETLYAIQPEEFGRPKYCRDARSSRQATRSWATGFGIRLPEPLH